MRERTLLAAALVTGFWAAACSKPAAETSRTSDKPAAVTPASLVSTPAPDAPIVSSLEAGRDLQLTLPRPPARKPVEAAVRGSGAASVAQANGEATHTHAAAAAELVPAMRVTTSSLASVSPEVVPAAIPAATSTDMGQATGGGSNGSDGSAREPSVVSRGPGIIIRGGMGGVRDDCDLHRRGGLGGFGGSVGIAVNRMAPGPGRSMGGPMIANPAGLRIR